MGNFTPTPSAPTPCKTSRFRNSCSRASRKNGSTHRSQTQGGKPDMEKRHWRLFNLRPKNPPKIPKYQKNAAFTRTFSKSLRELLPSSLWCESGTRQKLFRKACLNELFHFGWIFSGGFSSSDQYHSKPRLPYLPTCLETCFEVEIVTRFPKIVTNVPTVVTKSMSTGDSIPRNSDYLLDIVRRKPIACFFGALRKGPPCDGSRW